MITTMIVDDEPLAREGLRLLLEKEADVEIVSEHGDPRAALEAIRARPVDLLLLDVEMPEMRGFELIDRIEPRMARLIVLVTAWEEHAVRAFGYGVFDYVLKPLDEGRLRTVIDRVRARLSEPRAAGTGDGRRYVSRFAVPDRHDVLLIPARDVVWLESAGDYVRIHPRDGKARLVRATMSALEERLDPDVFARVHRSAIVNLEYVEVLHPWSHGEYEILLATGDELKLSRTYKKSFLARLAGKS